MLFLVGLGREDVSIIDRLLDLGATPRKPQYEMAPDEPLLLWNSGFDPAAVRMRLSEAARTQLEMHTAQCLQRHMVRAGVWAEAWAHLRRGEYDEDASDGSGCNNGRNGNDNGNGNGNCNVNDGNNVGEDNGDDDDDCGEDRTRVAGRDSLGAPVSLISTVTALSSVGSLAVGGNSRAAHVPLDRRATEPTYEERRLQLVERGGGAVSVANSYRATVEEFVAREANVKEGK